MSAAFASRFGVLSEGGGTVRVRCTVVEQREPPGGGAGGDGGGGAPKERSSRTSQSAMLKEKIVADLKKRGTCVRGLLSLSLSHTHAHAHTHTHYFSS